MLLRYNRPKLYRKQHDAIFNDFRYAIIEASTKSGKTLGCLIWLYEQALKGRPGYNYWWVAPVIPQAKIAYRRLLRAIPRYFYKKNDSELRVTLLNGATIWFKGSEKPDNLYGDDVYAAVMDEYTRCREEAWFAIRSTLTYTRGPIRLIGNVKSKKNWGYILARRAESDPNWHYAIITAWDAVAAGILSKDEIFDAKSTLPEFVFNQLYLAIAADEGANPFGLDNIDKCIAPLSGNDPICWGWDLGKSVDYTVGIALDKFGMTANFERFQRSWELTTQTISNKTGNLPALIDSTGLGDPIVERLQLRKPMLEGYIFTQKSKQQLMEGLALAIQTEEVTFPEGQITRELKEFEYEHTRTGVRYAAPVGFHDDCVMALALAVRKQQDLRMLPRPTASTGR